MRSWADRRRLVPLSALGESVLLTATLFILILSVGMWYLYSPRTRIADVAVTIFGPLYTGFMLSAIVLTRASIPALQVRCYPSVSALLFWGQRFVCLYGWKQVRQTQDGS